jgi:RHH-type proline utilization regulon transcriptional repressor/proline dehydrogenase/delta 1-pyrroline-5-carboxylate dehydrogenase
MSRGTPHEYLTQPGVDLPGPMRFAVNAGRVVPSLTAAAARQAVRQMRYTFITGETPEQVVAETRDMRELPLAFTVDLLGETVVSEAEAQHYLHRYIELIELLGREVAGWPANPQIDTTRTGQFRARMCRSKSRRSIRRSPPSIPRQASLAFTTGCLPVLKRAADLGVFINFDMEHTQLKDLTLELFIGLVSSPELQGRDSFGIALQGYLKESERDFERLLHCAQKRGAPLAIRLIKGAYWDYETIMAAQRGWPVRVFEVKSETDAAYERLARRLLENEAHIRCAFGTHSVRSIAACIVHAEDIGLAPNAYEFQMLYGMAEPIKRTLIDQGLRVRDYCPIGETLTGMSYLVRRLLENTSNEGFLRAAFSAGVDPEQLLRDPATIAVKPESPAPLPFKNEPHTDFSMADQRARMAVAIERASTELGRKYPLLVDGKELLTRQRSFSVNPARPGASCRARRMRIPCRGESAVETCRKGLVRGGELASRSAPVASRKQRSCCGATDSSWPRSKCSRPERTGSRAMRTWPRRSISALLCAGNAPDRESQLRFAR